MTCPKTQGTWRERVFFTFARHVGRWIQLFAMSLLSPAFLGKQKAPSSSNLHDEDLYPIWKIWPAILPQCFLNSSLFSQDQPCSGSGAGSSSIQDGPGSSTQIAVWLPGSPITFSFHLLRDFAACMTCLGRSCFPRAQIKHSDEHACSLGPKTNTTECNWIHEHSGHIKDGNPPPKALWSSETVSLSRPGFSVIRLSQAGLHWQASSPSLTSSGHFPRQGTPALCCEIERDKKFQCRAWLVQFINCYWNKFYSCLVVKH